MELWAKVSCVSKHLEGSCERTFDDNTKIGRKLRQCVDYRNRKCNAGRIGGSDAIGALWWEHLDRLTEIGLLSTSTLLLRNFPPQLKRRWQSKTIWVVHLSHHPASHRAPDLDIVKDWSHLRW